MSHTTPFYFSDLNKAFKARLTNYSLNSNAPSTQETLRSNTKFSQGSTAISKNTINYLRAFNATSNRLISTQIYFHLKTIEFCSENPKSLWCLVSTRTRRSKVISVSRHSQLTMIDSLTSSKSLKTNLSIQTNAK